MATSLGHQLAATDKSVKSEPNGMVVERKRITTYRTEATATTGGVGKEEEKMKKIKKNKTLDNIPATTEPPLTAEAEEAD